MTKSLNVDFFCVLCSSIDTPSVVKTSVKGDRDDALTVVRCSRCGHYQLNPPMYTIDHYNQDDQVNFVIHDYGTPLEKLIEHSWIEASRRVKRFSEKNVLPIFSTFPDLESSNSEPIRVLDIGGGYGFFASELKRHYPEFQVQVMEPSEKRARLGEKYLTEAEELRPVPEFLVKFLDESFVDQFRATYDIVTFWHVLEHVPDPVSFLRLAMQLVKPGGVVCVEVPNVDDELMKLSPAFEARNYMIEHISYFSQHTLETVAKQANPSSIAKIYGYQRYGIFNYFHWIFFNRPQGAEPDMFKGEDRWWLETSWRVAREQALTSDALFMCIYQ